MSERWIGVDFDGTLVEHQFPEIGPTIQPMLLRVSRWIASGIKVKIVTARAANPDGRINEVRDWLDSYGLRDVEITCSKDIHMTELWDDRAVAVERNTGKQLSPSFIEGDPE